MHRTLRRGLRAITLTAVLATTFEFTCSPVTYAEDTLTATNVAEALDDGVATTIDALDTVAKGCVPYVYEWTHIVNDPVRLPTKANGSIWYRESGGAKARIICPVAVRLSAYVMDETTTSPIVWPTVVGKVGEVFSSAPTPSVVALADVPYEGLDATDGPVIGGTVPGIRPYGQITVHVEVHRRLSTARYSPITNGCVEFYYLHQAQLGTFVSDPTRGGGYGFGPCPATAKIAAFDTLDNIDQG